MKQLSDQNLQMPNKKYTKSFNKEFDHISKIVLLQGEIILMFFKSSVNSDNFVAIQLLYLESTLIK